jgi:hypothetical protein
MEGTKVNPFEGTSSRRVAGIGRAAEIGANGR